MSCCLQNNKNAVSFAKIVIGRHFAERELFVTLETEDPVVMFPESRSVTHSDEGNANLLEVFVHVLFHIKSHLTGALVQNSVGWFVVNKSTHGDALLFTSGKDIIPVVFGAPASLTGAQIAEITFFKNLLEVIISNALFLLSLRGVRVDELISHGSIGKVRSLRNVENLFCWGLENFSIGARPESSKNTEETTLSTSVGSSNHHVHSRGDFKAHIGNEDITIG